MWPFTKRRSVVLRDFDWTGFSLGQGLSTPLTAHAALRRISGWIAIATRPVVDRLAGLQWQGISDAGEEIEKSRFVELLRRPNPAMSGGLLLRSVAQTLVLAGEAYLIVRRGRRTGRVAELWPVSPSHVSRVWQDGSLFYDISPANVGEPERLAPSEVVRIYRPRPDDLLEPYGAAAMVWDEVLAEQGWSQSVRNWFTNDGRPQLALEFSGSDWETYLGDSAHLDKFIQAWSETQRRRDGALLGVPVPLPPNSTLKELAGLVSAEHLGPTELALRQKIMAALGTPGFLVGFAGEANRASAEAALWSFDFSAVAPWAQLIVDAINYRLGDEFEGERVQFADWIWRDRLAESEIDERLLTHLVISPNEARAKRNLKPASWGDLPVGQIQDVAFDGTRKPERPEE
jgi:HK97 family phage portal protein